MLVFIMNMANTKCPLRYPDFTPLQFYPWAALKYSVYGTKWRTLQDLNRIIKNVAIPPANIQKYTFSFNAVVNNALMLVMVILGIYDLKLLTQK
jgi:hypothetical protein